MIDECRHCTGRGDLAKCQSTECVHHSSWMVKELLKESKKLRPALLCTCDDNTDAPCQRHARENQLQNERDSLRREVAALVGVCVNKVNCVDCPVDYGVCRDVTTDIEGMHDRKWSLLGGVDNAWEFDSVIARDIKLAAVAKAMRQKTSFVITDTND